MSKIRVESKCALYDGMSLTFKAPCDSNAVDGLNVYYAGAAQTFTFRDALRNDLAGVDNLFITGTYVKVVLDTTNNYAYVQNTETNSYIEARLDGIISDETKALYGLDSGAVADDVLEKLSKASLVETMQRPVKVAGVDWELKNTGSGEPWVSVCYGNGKFVAVNDMYDSIMYSENGESWSFTTISGVNGLLCVCYGDDKFVAVGNKCAAYSEDGINWTLAHTFSVGNFKSVCYGNGKFVAVGSDKFAYSTDGIVWTEISTPAVAGAIYSVCYGNGLFVAVGERSFGFYSEDGVNWTTMSVPAGTCMSICYGEDKFVVVAYNSNSVAYSYDGKTWSTDGLPDSRGWRSVCYGNGRYIAVDDASGYPDAAMSTDGITWSMVNLPAGNTSYYGVCYGDNKFIVVARGSAEVVYSESTYTYEDALVNVLGRELNVGVKIETGSYTGTGKGGSKNPNSLTFSFAPKLVFMLGYYGGTPANVQAYFGRNISGSRQNVMYAQLLTTEYRTGGGFEMQNYSAGMGKKSADGKTFYWYSASSSNAEAYQFNSSGTVYEYLAIG